MINDQIRTLSSKIGLLNTTGKQSQQERDNGLDPDYNWGASYFCAEILENSVHSKYFLLDRTTLQRASAEFTALTKHSINVDELLEIGWLREVFTQVEIPSVIEMAAKKADELKDFATEVDFFKSLYHDTQSKTIVYADLLSKASAYEKANQITLKIKATEKLLYSSSKQNGTIEIFDTATSKSVFQHLHKLLFINFLANLKHNAILKIPVQKVKDIHSKHKSYFKYTPDLASLIEQRVFSTIDGEDAFTFDFRYSEPIFSPFVRDRYAALLWDRLLDNDEFNNNHDRLVFWYSRTVAKQGHVDLHHFPKESKEIFLETAYEVINEDQETSTGLIEYRKLLLDVHQPRLHDFTYVLSLSEDSDYFAVSEKSLYVIYKEVNALEELSGRDLMLLQKCRASLDFFVTCIVKNESPYQVSQLGKLLLLATTKPHIFWQTCYMVQHWRPELVPILAQYPKVESLSLLLSSKLNISNALGVQDGAIIKEQFACIVRNISENIGLKETEKAKILFECLFEITLGKFKIATGSAAGRRKDKTFDITLARELKEIFENATCPGMVHNDKGRFKQKLYPSLLSGIFANITKFKLNDFRQNGLLSLPYEKIDLILYLLELSLRPEYKAYDSSESIFVEKLCQAFTRRYSSTIKIKEIQRYNYTPKSEIITDTPTWTENTANNKLLDFGPVLLYLEKSFKLQDFLDKIKLKFIKEENEYDKSQLFIAQKLRTQLFLLMQAYNSLYRKQGTDEFDHLPLKSTLIKIETTITEYVCRYCIFKPDERRYNIFNSILERGYWNNISHELLPLIGHILNRFEKANRQSVITELIKTDQIVRSLKLLEYIVSQEEYTRLSKIITDDNFKKHLKKLNYSDLQFVIESFSNDPTLTSYAETALQTAEEMVKGFNKPYFDQSDQIFLYRTKLALAYMKGDIEDIDKVPTFGAEGITAHGYSFENEKDFYRALIHLKHNRGELAYDIFNRQFTYSSDYTDKSIYALNRFASKISWAKHTTTKRLSRSLYTAALAEWNNYIATAKENDNLEDIAEKVAYNKLSAFAALGHDQKFDEEFYQLETEQQLKSNFLELRIRTLMDRKMEHQALELLHKAKRFHQLEEGDYPKFIIELEQLTMTVETIDYLAEQYRRIFNSAPEKMIQMIPDIINTGKKLPEFILNEIIASANTLLININSISQIKFEDKYTDLMMICLNGRFTNYNWHVTMQRSGRADSIAVTKGKPRNPGEIDFAIMTQSGERLAVCEALILKGLNTTEITKHNLKIFTYDHARKIFVVIVYFIGPSGNFENTWQEYCKVVAEVIDFPSNYHLMKRSVQILTNNGTNDSVKAGMTKHNNGATVFHVFINLNYED